MGLSNAAQAVLMFLAIVLPVFIAWTANGAPTDKTSVMLVVSDFFSGVLVFIKEILGGQPPATTAKTYDPDPKPRSRLKAFFLEFLHDKTARFPRGRKFYDPDPGRRHKRHRGHRKGVEPAGLKRWRLSHKRRTHDPGYSHSLWKGSRGGHYFRGPHKRRYDPPKRRRFSSARRYGGKAEGMLNKWAMAIGALVGFGYPTYQAYQKYAKLDPTMTIGRFLGFEPHPAGKEWMSSAKSEIMTLVGQDPRTGTGYVKQSPLAAWNSGYNYLQNKFFKQGEAWVVPFWLSLGAFFGTWFAKKIGRLGKFSRILTPLHKFSKGTLIATTIGALTMPGCEPPGPPNPNTIPMVQTSPGQYAPAPVPPNMYQTENRGAF